MGNSVGSIDLHLADQLILEAYWTGGSTPKSTMFLLGLTTGTFPCLLENEGFVGASNYQGLQLLKYLSDELAHDQAMAFMQRIVELEPDDMAEDGFTWVAAMLNQYALRLEELAQMYKAEWKYLPDRPFALDLFRLTMKLKPYASGQYSHPFAASNVLRQIYPVDGPLFDEFLGSNDLPAWVLKDVLAPLKQGDVSRQMALFAKLQTMHEKGKLKDDDLTLGAPGFWSEIRQVLDQCEASHRNDLVLAAHHLGAQIFSIDQMTETKKNFMAKKLASMVINQPWLALQAKNAGLGFSGQDCRAAMKALEKASALFGRFWEGMVGSEDVDRLRATLEALMSDVAPDQFAKRKMAESYVSVLAVLMPESGWMQKASNRGRDNIFAADLGL